jgi:formylglycine-generating enzyme required for sulfatase activity
MRDNPRLLELYSTPYFLKLLSEQLADYPRIASERAALFTGFVRRALKREIDGRNPLFVRDGVLLARDRDRIGQLTWADPYDLPRRGPLIPRLEALAYAMQERFIGSDGKQVMVPLDDALARLDHPQAEGLLKAGEQLAILDEERKIEQVRFFHQLLQEYFAARQLRAQPVEAARLAHSEWHADRIKPSLADKLATLQDFEPLPPPDSTGWEETTVLAASMAADPDAFVMSLVEANLALAGRCAAVLSATDRAASNTVTEIQHRLVARSRDRDADLRARIAAARALGELGDPRFERCGGPHGDYLRPPLVAIEAATYRIGSDEGLYADEAPAHEVALAAYAIGRFPVTNAEWRLFIDAGGYQSEHWWHTEAARRWQRGEGIADGPKQAACASRQTVRDNPAQIDDWLAAGRITSTQARDFTQWYVEMSDGAFEALLDNSFSSDVQTQPRWWHDPAYRHPAQPVVGVCWHEARAYCAWLSAQTGHDYRLPNEIEWEAAARGQAGRRYAWEGDFDPSRCNSFESHVRGTTPVGVFPGGDTPQGVADMSGNVWEWTGSLYRPYPYQADDGRENPDDGDGRRVVRGGSWNNNRENARCAYRNNDPPDNRNNNPGPKRRKISAAPFRDRVVHHALCNVIEPRFERLFIADSYANRTGKGTHRAIDRLQQFAQRHRYVLRADIVKHFPSIDHQILRATLARVVPEADLMALIDRIIASGAGVLDDEYAMTYFPGDDLLAACRPRGLPIGNLTSQFWSNCYLHPFDQFVTRELRCAAYLRYVDDFALFSDSKCELWAWKRAITERLARLRLIIHERPAQVLPVENGIPWLGFVVFPTHRRVKARKVRGAANRLRGRLDDYLAGHISFAELNASVKGWVNHIRYADTGACAGTCSPECDSRWCRKNRRALGARKRRCAALQRTSAAENQRSAQRWPAFQKMGETHNTRKPSRL